jgi:hypothetical protein
MDPDQLLADPAVQAAVGALASRNAHHFAGMDDDERTQALQHWQELAVDVLTAARAVLGGEHGPIGEMPADGTGPGRAVVVFEDASDDDVSVHVAFHPELEDMGNDQVAGTPAQLTAMALLQQLAEGEPEAE